MFHNCSACNMQFYSLQNLTTHMRSHQVHYPFVCSYCGRGFRSTLSYISHIQSHKETPEMGGQAGSPSRCQYYGFIAPDNQSLQTHRNEHPRRRDWMCRLCRESYCSQQNLVDHLESSHGIAQSLSMSPSLQYVYIGKPVEVIRDDPSRRSEILNQIVEPDLVIPPPPSHGRKVLIIEPDQYRMSQSSLPTEGTKNDLYKCSFCDMQFNSCEDLNEHTKKHLSFVQTTVCKDEKPNVTTDSSEITEITKVPSFQNQGCETSPNIGLQLETNNYTSSFGHEIPPTHTKEDNMFSAGSLEVIKNELTYEEKASPVKRPERPHVCPCCNEAYTDKPSLQRHLYTHIKDCSLTCPLCCKKLSKRVNLVTHIYNHTGEKPHVCQQCGKGFNTSGNLKKHVKTHQTVSCSQCYKVFTTFRQLERHFDTHSGKKCFVCYICNAEFTQPSDLIAHTHKHGFKGVKTFRTKSLRCEHCQKAFRSAKSLKVHKECKECIGADHTVTYSHPGKQPRACLHKPTTLRQNVESHNEAFRCHVCGEQFNNSTLWREHTYIHAVEAVHQSTMNTKESLCSNCFLCVQGFSTADDLNEHLLSHISQAHRTTTP